MDQLKMQEMTFREYEDLPEDAARIRTEVFIEEQGFSGEFDEIDRTAAVHLVLYEKGIPAGVCRIFPALASESEKESESESASEPESALELKSVEEPVSEIKSETESSTGKKAESETDSEIKSKDNPRLEGKGGPKGNAQAGSEEKSELERKIESSAGGGAVWIIGRLAVRKSYRGKGCGSALMRRAEEAVMERGGRKIVLHAQVHAASFYEKLGYRRAGEVSEIAGCPHVRMEKVPG